MLAFSRTIERSLLSNQPQRNGTLYVGFQTAEKVDAEAARYVRLRNRGVRVVGFGEGELDGSHTGSFDVWTSIKHNTRLMENQWYLVSTAPEAVAFVGWEVSPDELWGKYGVTREGKEFIGFVSGDERVVKALAAHLDDVAEQHAGAARPLTHTVGNLLAELRAQRVLTLTDRDDTDALVRARTAAFDGCKNLDAQLLLYDMSALSHLVNNYPDEERRWRPERVRALLEQKTHAVASASLRVAGRDYLANQIEQLQSQGVPTLAIIPYGVGFAHLGMWCEAERVDAVVLPAEYAQSPVVRRLQGLTVEKLQENAGVHIVIDDPDKGAWLVAR